MISSNANSSSSSCENPLIFAIRSGISDSIIKLLITHTKEINFETSNGETPLTNRSCRNTHYNGFNINYLNKNEENALIYLIKNNKISKISLSFLLNNNIGINVKDIQTKNALMYSVESQKPNLVKDILDYYIMDNKFIINLLMMKQQNIKVSNDYLSELINKELKRININEQDDYGNSALLIACGQPNEQIVRLLLKFGADVDTRDNDDGNLERVQCLIEYGADINATDTFSGTPLIVACEYGQYEIVKFLLENGADINSVNANGDKPIHVACLVEDRKITELLMEHGKNTYGSTLLMTSVNNENVEMVKLLLELNINNINEKNGEGKTALFFATENKNYEIVKLLLEHGADVNIPNNHKSTPLTLASEDGKKILDNDGDSSLKLAKEGHFKEIEELLLEYGAKL
ncbi:ankyrin [Neocallimastix sp. 'constans']